MILLDANPLEDVRNARNISGVAAGGRYVDKTELDKLRAELKNRYAGLYALSNDVDAALGSQEVSDRIRKLVATHAGDADAQKTIEIRVNAAGYAAGFAGDLDRAKALLKLNTEIFPDSANSWDSLAEITLYLGDKEQAIELYRKVLEIDPGFTNAAEQIDAIRNNPDQ